MWLVLLTPEEEVRMRAGLLRHQALSHEVIRNLLNDVDKLLVDAVLCPLPMKALLVAWPTIAAVVHRRALIYLARVLIRKVTKTVERFCIHHPFEETDALADWDDSVRSKG